MNNNGLDHLLFRVGLPYPLLATVPQGGHLSLQREKGLEALADARRPEIN